MHTARPDRYMDRIPGTRTGTATLSQFGAQAGGVGGRGGAGGRPHNRGGSGDSGERPGLRAGHNQSWKRQGTNIRGNPVRMLPSFSRWVCSLKQKA